MTHKCPSLVERHASCVTTAWASSVRTSCPADLHSYRPLSHSSVAAHRACVTACGSLPDMLHASQTFTKRAAFLPHRMLFHHERPRWRQSEPLGALVAEPAHPSQYTAVAGRSWQRGVAGQPMCT